MSLSFFRRLDPRTNRRLTAIANARTARRLASIKAAARPLRQGDRPTVAILNLSMAALVAGDGS